MALHVPLIVGISHPDFAVLTVPWELALRADGYADNTVKAYQNSAAPENVWTALRSPDTVAPYGERRACDRRRRAAHAGSGAACHRHPPGPGEQRCVVRRAGLDLGQGARPRRRKLAASAVVFWRGPGGVGLGLSSAPGEAERRVGEGRHRRLSGVSGPSRPRRAG